MPLARLSRAVLKFSESADPIGKMKLFISRNITKENHFSMLTFGYGHTICNGGSCFDCLFQLFLSCREIQVV